MSHPFAVFGSQNLEDDDGPVIDSLLIETDTPPKPEPEPIPPTPEDKPIQTTRLISGTMTLDASVIVEPFLLLAPDANRLQFNIFALSNAVAPTNADYVMVADEKGKLQLPVDGSVMPGGQMHRVHHTYNLPLDVHTGAIYVRPNPGLTGLMEITWTATTK